MSGTGGTPGDSAAQIVLIHQLEAALVEDGDGEFVVLDVHGEHRVALGAGHQRVGEVDVRLGDHQGVEALQQAGAGLAQGDDDEFAGGVRNALFHEELLGGFRIGNHKPGDGGVARVLHAQADHLDGRGAQQLDHGGKRAALC